MKRILGVVLAVFLLAGVFATVTAVTLTFMAVARPSFADDQTGAPGAGKDGDRTSTRKIKEVVMKGFVKDIERLAVENTEFRRVLYTAKNSQLVLMALKPGEEIGMEVHKLDQFFRVEEGSGEAVLDGVRTKIQAGFAVLVPAGAKHNIVNTGSAPLKLYTLYSPPNHRDGVVHHTRAEAEADSEHFDGKTTE
jgi:mannose-6-phosphate isomerase-like protein (cupin superfamily)